MTASTEHTVLPATSGRLHAEKSWGSSTTSATPTNEWLRIDLRSVKWVTGVQTQGRSDHDQRTLAYNIRYGDDVNTLVYISDSNGTPMVSVSLSQ